MRKMTVECKPVLIEEIFGFDIFSIIISIRMIQIIKLDLESGYKLGICEFVCHESHTPEELPLPEGTRIISRLREEGNIIICLVEGIIPEKFKIVPGINSGAFIWTPLLHSRKRKRFIRLLQTMWF